DWSSDVCSSDLATWAANGVDLREPRKPAPPEVAHDNALPWRSVIVMMVLLNEAWTWAMPSVTTRLIFFFVLDCAGLAMIYPLLPDGPARTLAGTCVGLGALATQRQAATVAQAAIATQVHQALDRHADLAAEVALDHELADLGADALDFRLGQVADLGRRIDAGRVAHLLRTGTADAVDALEPDPDMLLGRQIDARNTRHNAISNWFGIRALTTRRT